MVFQIGSTSILINVPRDVPCQILHCGVYPVVPFPRNGQKNGPLWQRHGSHMVLKVGSSWISINVPRDVPCKISHCWVYPVAPFPRNGWNMALLWPKHGPSNWYFLNLNHCAQGCSIPNFTLLGLSCSPFPRNGQKMALYGWNMVLTWSLKLVLYESQSMCPGMLHAKFHIAGCIP